MSTHRVNFCALSLHFFAKQFQARVPGIEARIRGVQARIPEEPFLKKKHVGNDFGEMAGIYDYPPCQPQNGFGH